MAGDLSGMETVVLENGVVVPHRTGGFEENRLLRSPHKGKGVCSSDPEHQRK